MSADELGHVHVVSAATLAAYQAARRQVLAVSVPLLRLAPPRPVPRPAREYVAFHAWRPGWLDLDAEQTSALCELAAGAAEAGDPARAAIAAALRARGWCDGGEPGTDLDAVAARALGDFPALQNPWELRRFLEVVAARRPRVVVEIGTAAGGLFYALARVADREATLCSIDLFAGPADDAVCDLLPALARRGQAVHVLRRSSLWRATRDELEHLLEGRPIDLLVIDGDHSYGATRADFEAYAPLVGKDGLIALHDVAVTPGNSGRGFETGLYWRELAAGQPTEVILDRDGVPGLRSQLHVPFAERRQAAFGIGLLAR